MNIRFISSFSIVTSDPAADGALFAGALGLPLQPPEGAPPGGYVFSEGIPGCKHFGVWPLSEVAEACFGTSRWPDTHPVPQASVEFDVDDVEAAARELEAQGYRMLHGPRTEPWGQGIARLQSADGVIVGVSYTPWMRED